ncbi:Biosynthetic Aromatic amino acid aminotransferase alpha [Fulvivirga imtechensis AK7]|uniref:Aminotransferase n=1 Tax=Fulvivirga imtechensis AK7 TaxID=1237149 RepID=L8JQ80_9BACT|nr:aminotransferase class I/II-fold pyridoxal phosphate-dependent enzyme [Fulvivirga imtechensis]ELR69644.1 Biosynthetic Aromatic amino acid aminotransferase alpha [Fulvivirga imtechensis AK7]
MIISKANRLNSVKEYYFSSKLRQIKELNDNGMNILNLAIGSPDLAPHEVVLQALTNDVFKQNIHGYQSYKGIDELRKAIADYYMATYRVSLDFGREILPLMGSKEGITHITQAFINPDDTVLVPDPGYPTYRSVSELAHANIEVYHLEEKNNFQIDIESLKQMDLDKAKLMWVNFPNMPTGVQPDMEIMKELVALAKKYQFLIVNDNPYSRILVEEPFSIFQIPGAEDVALELNSLSKSHNMAGWRLGWVCGKSTYIDTVLSIKSNADSGMFYPLQVAASKALQLGDDWYANLNTVYRKRQQKVFELFDWLGCTCNVHQTGLFVWARIPEDIADVEVLVDDLIFKAQIFITPGKIFGKNGERYLRASLCNNEEILDIAISRVKTFVLQKERQAV